MDEKLWEQIKKASEDSLKNPGENKKPLPKDKIGTNDNFIIVFRHGETEDNANRIFSGWRDAKLTPKGIEGAKKLSSKMNKLKIDLIVTSDQIRSKHTARLAFETHPNLENIKWEIDARIKERNYGDLNGESKEEAMRINPEQAIKWRRGYDFPPPNGESIKMVEERVWPFLDELIARIKKEKINVVLSAHSNSMRAIRRYFENLTIIEELTQENPLGEDFALYKIG
ncbi:hypothetical protein CO178_01140 [candidate division WWE3 bacterium CG_4_9_14_3_um_filter_34_6]|uniref:phosphoglycerate mutase (2,3-diphosphoglycerate-dependent) n=1 Tax=candidate division WWE3 bacterium CG_4_9_14_3_um_filter_34_6 TaxID=1975079 RepID=A0A2M7X4C1_UNCKA|nr:MAG: hypothetical protein CO178_01140 [candidate division WWE3 bacterium CG_4_9_14_3_um_filter_34_6]